VDNVILRHFALRPLDRRVEAALGRILAGGDRVADRAAVLACSGLGFDFDLVDGGDAALEVIDGVAVALAQRFNERDAGVGGQPIPALPLMRIGDRLDGSLDWRFRRALASCLRSLASVVAEMVTISPTDVSGAPPPGLARRPYSSSPTALVS
jgi:hypothetical protein